MNVDAAPESPAPAPASESEQPKRERTVALIAMGIVLPAIAWVVELVTHTAAEILINPFPTWWHVLFVALVPLANFGMVRVMRERGEGPWRGVLRWLVPVSLGVSLTYCIVFIPIAPAAAVGVIFFGLGLLPLAPYFSLFIAAATFWRGAKAGHFGPVRVLPLVGCLGAGVLLPVLPLIPAMLAQYSLAGIGEEGVARAEDMPKLRTWISQKAVAYPLHLVTSRFHWAYAQFEEVDRRAAWYRLFGESESAMEAQVPHWAKVREDLADRGWNWDAHQGEQVIGSLLPDLSLAESNIEVITYPETNVAYAQWTLVLQNQHPFQSVEGRTILQLPPGGTVSRLTLWIDGEPQEAAFGGKSQTTSAYQSVVSRRRDPVLVTWHQPEQVFMQCFPVPPQGRMQMRVAVTFPLLPTEHGNLRTALPRVVAANFSLPEQVMTQIKVDGGWAEASRSIMAGRLGAASLHESLWVTVDAPKLPQAEPVAIAHPHEEGAWIEQRFATIPFTSGVLRIVVDGSQSLGEVALELASALKGLRESPPVQVYLAGDTLQVSPTGTAGEAASWLLEQKFVGGQDSTDALIAALRDRATEASSDAPVMWIAGAQSVSWQVGLGGVRHLLRDLPARTLQVVRVGRGSNVLLDRLAEDATEVSWRPLSLENQINRMAGVLREALRPSPVLHYTTLRVKPPGRVLEGPAALHIARLWTARRVSAMVARDERLTAEAKAMAVRMQVVTPVSGAVVLESQQQYADAGLSQIDPMSAPAIPEPATYGLMLMGLLVAFYLWRRRQKGRCQDHSAIFV
ncbi:VIT domain-containing protein [Actomonas aquatica]|uniref:VIT domain-containing protein n=1 Tax=Actomonas aquatica TaxID=2866162 RepID=A0ABZ1CEG5_9BACT|nr:VIT domain-containing protein [Opitutus sp. WL0086]WRQ89836.1 VIT domain-containing protein [Opitutus sp. WL0086]